MALQLGELTAVLKSDTSDYIKGMEQAANASKRWESQTINASKSVSSVVATGMMAVGAAMVAAAGYGIKLAADMQTTATSFKVLLGSGEAATQMMSDLKKFAAETPFEFPEIAKAAKSLLAFGVTAQDIPRTLQMLGDVASGLNIPFGELSDIYGKIKVQGRVFAEDINQLQGRGIPVVQELAKQFGVTGEEIRGMVEKGMIGFPEIEKAFIALTGEGGKFKGMMAEQSQTINGLVSTLKDNLGQALTYIGEQLITTFDLPNKLAGAIAFLDQFNAAVAQVGTSQALANLIPPGLDVAIMAVAGALVGAMVPGWIAATTAAYGAATAFAAAMVPLLPFIAAGAALAAVAYTIYKNWAPIKGFFVDIVNTIVAKWKESRDQTIAVWESVKTYLMNKWQEIKAMTIEIWTSIVEFFKEWYPLILAAFGPLGLFVAFIIGHWDTIKTKTVEIWTTISDYLTQKWTEIKTSAIEIWNTISIFFSEWWDKLVSWVSSWDIWSYASSAWEALKTNVIGVLKKLADDAWEWGKNLVQGFIDGIKSKIGAVWNAAVNMAKAANEAVKNTLGIRSPSKVMMRLGEQATEGFVIGLLNGTKDVRDAVRNLTINLTNMEINTNVGTKGLYDLAAAAKVTTDSLNDTALSTEILNNNLSDLEKPHVVNVIINAMQQMGGSIGKTANSIVQLGTDWGNMLGSFAKGGVGGILGGISMIPKVISGVKSLWSSFSGKKKVAAFYADIAKQSEANRQAALANMQPYKDYAVAIRDFSKNSLIEIRGLAQGSVSFLENLNLVGTYTMVSQRIRRFFHKKTYWAQLWSYSFDEAGAESAVAFLDRFMEIASGLSTSVGSAFSSGIKEFLSGKTDWVTTLKEGIKNAIIDAITTAVMQATIIKGALGDLLGELAAGITAGIDVSPIIAKIGNTIPVIAKELEKILTPLQKTIAKVFPENLEKSIGSTVETVKTVAKSGIDPYMVPYVATDVNNPYYRAPAMASGGVVSRPTMALIGEAGPEAVIPLDKAGMTGGNQTIIIQLDGRTLTQSVVKNMPAVVRMKTGVSL